MGRAEPLRRDMAYDRGFLKVSWLFGIENTDEIAVTSLNFSDSAAVGWDPAVALGEIDITLLGPQLRNRMQTLLSSVNIKWADYSELRAVRIAGVLAAGTEIDPAKQYDDLLPVDGTAADVVPQASIVLSTRSGMSSGSANFGRMYLPHTAFAFAANKAVGDPPDISAFATAAAVFVNGCNTDLGAVVVQSIRATIMTQVVGGTSKTINQVAIGDVVDTQRRRRNALPETYVFRAIP